MAIEIDFFDPETNAIDSDSYFDRVVNTDAEARDWAFEAMGVLVRNLSIEFANFPGDDVDLLPAADRQSGQAILIARSIRIDEA
jgi:hypothetical protein